MSISAVGSATSVPVNNTASTGGSAADEATESTATKLAEQRNGGNASKAASATAGKSSSKSNDLAQLKMYANQHLSAGEIAQRLGKSVSTVIQEAAAAGVNLNTASSSTATVNSATGNNVNKTA